MNIFNWRPKTITLDNQKSVLLGRRDPATGQSVLRTESDADSHPQIHRGIRRRFQTGRDD
jgi:hypothetical protein